MAFRVPEETEEDGLLFIQVSFHESLIFLVLIRFSVQSQKIKINSEILCYYYYYFLFLCERKLMTSGLRDNNFHPLRKGTNPHTNPNRLIIPFAIKRVK